MGFLPPIVESLSVHTADKQLIIILFFSISNHLFLSQCLFQINLEIAVHSFPLCISLPFLRRQKTSALWQQRAILQMSPISIRTALLYLMSVLLKALVSIVNTILDSRDIWNNSFAKEGLKQIRKSRCSRMGGSWLQWRTISLLARQRKCSEGALMKYEILWPCNEFYKLTKNGLVWIQRSVDLLISWSTSKLIGTKFEN